MLVKTMSQQCKREITQPYWPAFLDVLSDDSQNRLVTIHILDENEDDLKVLKQTTLRSVDYDHTAAQVSITVGRDDTTYSYIVSEPKRIEVFYEQGNQIFAVAIINDERARTIIYFEEDALVVYGNAVIPEIRAEAICAPKTLPRYFRGTGSAQRILELYPYSLCL